MGGKILTQNVVYAKKHCRSAGSKKIANFFSTKLEKREN
jgi:hypothetical protein